MAKCERRLYTLEDGSRRYDEEEALVLHLGLQELNILHIVLGKVLNLRGLFSAEMEDPRIDSILKAMNSAEVIEVDAPVCS